MLEVVVRGVDGNSSSYMVMVGLLMFNVYWVQFEIESTVIIDNKHISQSVWDRAKMREFNQLPFCDFASI